MCIYISLISYRSYVNKAYLLNLLNQLLFLPLFHFHCLLLRILLIKVLLLILMIIELLISFFIMPPFLYKFYIIFLFINNITYFSQKSNIIFIFLFFNRYNTNIILLFVFIIREYPCIFLFLQFNLFK